MINLGPHNYPDKWIIILYHKIKSLSTQCFKLRQPLNNHNEQVTECSLVYVVIIDFERQCVINKSRLFCRP